MQQETFLVEIQTEELPPKVLERLADAFLKGLKDKLQKAEFSFGEAKRFATPRRLAVMISDLESEQPDSTNERKGPATSAAYDADGKPTPALLGFARSCNVPVSELITIKNPQGSWVGFQQKIKGKKVTELLPTFVQQTLTELPIPKRMRWGAGTAEFIRPVHAIVMLYGENIISATILGTKSDRVTYGHRFHCKDPISIPHPSAYLDLLKNPGFVIADFAERKSIIRRETENIIQNHFGDKAKAFYSDALLTEVTGLVEWPIAIFGNFDKAFLNVPQEALISAMQDHQRYFPVMDHSGKLLPHFVTISNIESHDIQRVITGNERVLRARLSDAAFFFEQDKKHTLQSRLDKLKGIVFQAKLGSLHDKAERIAKLASFIAKKLEIAPDAAKHAGLLAKCDLTTDMVREFPELQGVMGYYYALNDGEPEAIAKAITEHYLPRFSGDALPATQLGCAVALADRLDTLVGVFGINEAPTGDKDPFGLRRAALGVLRIIVEKSLDLDLSELVTTAIKGYKKLPNKNTLSELLSFMQDRLKFWYQEQGISTDIFTAVSALALTKPYDVHCRMQAVATFKKLPSAENLKLANKRISNILQQYTNKIAAKKINTKLFETSAEKTLATKINHLQKTITDLSETAKYEEVLSELANLREPVDDFFDKVLVMTDDKQIRENRILLLKQLRGLFLQVADIALLQ